jgi:crotonobetainyl-CoA:carnitine CoA-transferase CaiB-like acyl-CoA transferase
MILSDLGADVIKVERPGTGEDARVMGPHRGQFGAYFTTLNRGKRSIGVDITTAEGREATLRLAATCDILLENFRGGKAAAVGLDEASVRLSAPDIIYASLSAYGPFGPDYTRPGYDAILQARTGIMSVTGTPDSSAPVRAGVSILDLGTGVWMALGILAALLGKQRTGRGQRVDASLFQTGTMLMCYHLLYRQFAGVNPKPQGSRHTAFAPYGAFEAGDGPLMIGISSDKAFRRLCDALGHPSWASDERFVTNTDRVRNADALEDCICTVLRTNTRAHWSEILDGYDVANDPVQTAEQLLGDRQISALDQLAEVPLGTDPPALVPKLPLGFSHTPPEIHGPPPRVGQHTRELLREAGYAQSEIDDLIRNGVCSEG